MPKMRLAAKEIFNFVKGTPVFSRQFCSNVTKKPQIAIVGSGPAGFYTAQQILKGYPSAIVDIYEKLPVPFGLVRFGVAPDHPEVKNVINTFTQTANKDGCSFIGNVTVGKDVSYADLKKAYSAVVMAYGSEDDRAFGIPGEDLPGVLSARSFVGWYNGLPENRELDVNLDMETVVIIGQGNVAIDCARILLTPIDILKKTDITNHALEKLSKSKVKTVHLVGRRGPLQVAFTIAELREMVKLPGCRAQLQREDFEGLQDHIKDIPRPRKRLTELLIKSSLSPSDQSDLEREWVLTFLRSPLEILPDSSGQKVGSIRLEINTLEDSNDGNQKAVGTGETEELSCGMVLRSIGYKSLPIDPTVPFDAKNHVIPNQKGRVTGEKGLYCSGWVKRGPVGVIVSTMTDAFETGKVITEDLQNGEIEVNSDHGGKSVILEMLKQKGIKPVNFNKWTKIDEYEVKMGAEIGKPREKLTDVKEMIKVALD